jgi:MYXO-CTERM domain-containing protein
MNGGTLSVTGAANATFGNWNFDQGVVTPGATAATTSTISGGNAALTQTGGTIFNVQGTDTLNVSTVLAHVTGAGDTGLIKNGGGTLAITSASTYTTATTVNAGKLLVNGSIASPLAVTVNGGTLGGTGSIAGPVSVSTGTLSPGTSIESLKTGALSLGDGSTYVHEMSDAGATGADLTASSGGLTVAGTSVLSVADTHSGPWNAGDKITLISYTTGGWNGGTFTLASANGGGVLADDTTFTDAVTGTPWTINYNDTTGGLNFAGDVSAGSSFVTLTAIPEPGGLSLLAAAGLLGLRRRRRNQNA